MTSTSESHDERDILETPMEICWQFAYAIDEEKLERLYRKAKKLQWDADETLDWSVTVDPSRPLIDEGSFDIMRLPFVQKLAKPQQELFRSHIAAFQLSQFLHGEQGALMTAAALTHAVPHYESKLYTATQTMDEARHVEVFERYIKKVALIYPMGTGLRQLIDATLTADNWVKMAIGMNMVVEGLALGSFHNMRAATSCGLLRDLLHYVLRDEARHVAFGGVYVGKAIADMHPDDREDIGEFAADTLRLMRKWRKVTDQGFDPGFLQVLSASDIDPADLIKDIMEVRAAGVRLEPPTGQVHAFRHLMMPALLRVGALTPRVCEQLASEGMPIVADKKVLEQFEQGMDMDMDAVN